MKDFPLNSWFLMEVKSWTTLWPIGKIFHPASSSETTNPSADTWWHMIVQYSALQYKWTRTSCGHKTWSNMCKTSEHRSCESSWTCKPCVNPLYFRVTSSSTVLSQSVRSLLEQPSTCSAFPDRDTFCKQSNHCVFLYEGSTCSAFPCDRDTLCKQSNQVSPFVCVCLQQRISTAFSS